MPTSDVSNEFTRLHITPLDAELFKIVIPASVAPNAKNVSYHTIETFPEKRYGFVDLPVADAEKLRAKLNGAVVKGSKMRIEKARPENIMEPSEALEKKEKKSKKDKKGSKDKESSKKRKRDPNVDEGIELSDRKVKRGWTETTDESVKRKKKDRSEKNSKSKDKDDDKKSKEKKKRTKTKYTDGPECLLKTQIPPNKELPDKDKADKKKRRKGNEREFTIHEFEKTTRFPSFLKDNGPKVDRADAEFVEGKGWVDAEGNIVEAVVEKKPKKVKKEKKAKQQKSPTPEPESDSETSSSGTSSDDESEVGESPIATVQAQAQPTPAKTLIAADDDSDTSSEGSSSGEEDSPAQVAEQTTPVSKGDLARPASSESARSLTIKIPPPDTPEPGKVHPLEALYKRRKAGEADTETPAKEAFSFFGGGDNEEEDDNGEDKGPVMPMTPFTKQDFEWRNVRSAAPTPDTAHHARMQNFWASQNDDDDDEMDDAAEEEEDDEAQAPTAGDRATSDFQNWFWENRKELNQSWMKRRKTAAKEKRHRENKARASRAV